MVNAPCFECDKHSTECHADCPDYAAWVDVRAAERAARRIPRDADAHTKATIARNLKRAQTKRQVGLL